jgi:hypothetical protein
VIFGPYLYAFLIFPKLPIIYRPPHIRYFIIPIGFGEKCKLCTSPLCISFNTLPLCYLYHIASN